VQSLARPGRNFTGLTTMNRELMSKRPEVLKETIPGLTRVDYLANPGYAVHAAQLTEMEAAARGLGLTLYRAEVRAPVVPKALTKLPPAHSLLTQSVSKVSDFAICVPFTNHIVNVWARRTPSQTGAWLGQPVPTAHGGPERGPRPDVVPGPARR
jgi:hypothetical protein